MRITVLFFSLIFLISNAVAGDFSSVRSIGFSADGKYYAFEQYGIQDGSGFPYAEIFIINTERDIWVKGTPLRMKVQNENASLYRDVRLPLRNKAAPILQKLGINRPGNLLVYNPITELSGNSHKVTFSLSAQNLTSNYSYDLKMSLFRVPMPECAHGMAEPMGFSLILKRYSGGEKRVLHKDSAYKRLPKSRGCAIDYRITHVFYFHAKARDVLVNLVEVFSNGFEGEDGRFIAIPVVGREGF